MSWSGEDVSAYVFLLPLWCYWHRLFYYPVPFGTTYFNLPSCHTALAFLHGQAIQGTLSWSYSDSITGRSFASRLCGSILRDSYRADAYSVNSQLTVHLVPILRGGSCTDYEAPCSSFLFDSASLLTSYRSLVPFFNATSWFTSSYVFR